MAIQTITWANNSVKLIDQTLLPHKLHYVYCKDLTTLWWAIKKLKVRGAPAIGVAAGFGALLAATLFKGKNIAQFRKYLLKSCDYLGSSRPTAVNLFNALNQMRVLIRDPKLKSVSALKASIKAQAFAIYETDRKVCRQMGAYGSNLIKSGQQIMTVCNAGALATVDYGTALGVMYSAKARGKKFKVYACETRPLLQGARLTAWELLKNKIDTTLICDNMAATLMKQGKVDGIFAGADRIASNGDAANKIGTYSLAVLAKHHGIPFYIVAPFSTFDLSIATGKQIPIEERGKEEVMGFGPVKTAPAKVKVYNPAFDVTNHQLITAIATEAGVIRPPFATNIRKAFQRYAKPNSKA